MADRTESDGLAVESTARPIEPVQACQACHRGSSPGKQVGFYSDVAPTQVAAWARPSAKVLLEIYVKCINGQDDITKRRIAEGLRDDGDAQADDARTEEPGHDDEASADDSTA